MSKRASAAGGATRAAPSTSVAAASSSGGDGELHPDRWSHALQRDVAWSKTDLLCVIYWLRQLLAVLLGVTWGLIPLTGLPAHMLYVGLSAGILFLYYTHFLRVDDEDDLYGGRWALMTEGMWSGYATFLLCWILVYSLPY